jgi:hypothetical protein
MAEERKVVVPGLSLAISTEGGSVTVAVRGRLDADTTEVLRTELREQAGDVDDFPRTAAGKVRKQDLRASRR